jgi:lipid-A-disaccharide synthase
VRTIRRSVDLMLSIFPFEEAFLRQHQVPVRYVGHPLAEAIPLEPDRAAARARLGLPTDRPVLALLPGSRMSEVRSLADIFLATARWCLERRPQLHCVIPLVNAPIRTLVETAYHRIAPQLPLTLVDGRSHEVLAAADVVLTASGTATLEALLHQRPMVVAYRLNPITYWLATRLKLVRVPYVALSNLLAGEVLAPERLQDACRPAVLGRDLLALLDDPQRMANIQARYRQVHQVLRCDARQRAAAAILELVRLDTVGGTAHGGFR